MPLVTFQEHNQLGEIVINNPPQNRFTFEAITDLSNAITAAAASDVRAVLLRAEGDNFPSGRTPRSSMMSMRPQQGSWPLPSSQAPTRGKLSRFQPSR